MKNIEDDEKFGNDDFWDFGLKDNKKIKPLNQNFDTTTTLFFVDGEEKGNGEKIPHNPNIQKNDKSKKKLSFDEWVKNTAKKLDETKESDIKPLCEYETENPLIKKVKVVRYDKGYLMHKERFVTDAEENFEKEGIFEKNEPFSMIHPQLCLMTDVQKKCYYGFRTEIRKGNYVQVDESYIYLYLYELINLTDKMDAKTRASKIIDLLNNYTYCSDGLYSDMCNWLADICFINQLYLPENAFGKNKGKVIKNARIKEFFMYPDNFADKDYSFLLVNSNYDYRKSKYYGQYKEYYKKYVKEASIYAINCAAQKDKEFTRDKNSLITLKHYAFQGALYTYKLRYSIEIDCVCITRLEEVKKVITDIIKYSENRLRMALGIKSRLTVRDLPLDTKADIKEYYSKVRINMERAGKIGGSTKIITEVPEYEKLYEPKEKGISFENAREIEKNSWIITDRLVKDEDYAEIPEDEEINANEEIAENNELNAETEETEETAETDVSTEITALKLIYEKKYGKFAEFCKENNVFPEAMADRINEFLFDEIGDNAVEFNGENYVIIEDYAEEIEEIVEK